MLHALQVVNMSSGLASIGNVKNGLTADPVPPIFKMELPYRCSKAALNMRELLHASLWLLCSRSLVTKRSVGCTKNLLACAVSAALGADLKDCGFTVISLAPGQLESDICAHDWTFRSCDFM